eukprot:scaffold110754_cov69-Phaeocystis_antarctica.AAC.2
MPASAWRSFAEGVDSGTCARFTFYLVSVVTPGRSRQGRRFDTNTHIRIRHGPRSTLHAYATHTHAQALERHAH